MPSMHRESTARGRLLVMVLAALLVAASLVPASAAAQGSGSCTVNLNTTQDRTVAALDVECDAEFNFVRIEILDQTNEATLEGNAGTRCERIDSRGLVWDCFPVNDAGDETPDTLISARATLRGGDEVCVDPRLRADFTVDFVDGRSERIEGVEVEGCSDTPSDTPARANESLASDNQAFPEGGVDSGAGGSAGSRRDDSPLPIAAVPVLALVLAGAALVLRRRVH